MDVAFLHAADLHPASPSVGLSSTDQELAKRLFQVEAQEARMAALEQKAAEVASLEEQVADLKKMVGQLAEAAKTSKLTAAAEDDQAKALTTASLVH